MVKVKVTLKKALVVSIFVWVFYGVLLNFPSLTTYFPKKCLFYSSTAHFIPMCDQCLTGTCRWGRWSAPPGTST